MVNTLKQYVPLRYRTLLRQRYEQARRSARRLLHLFDPLMPPDELMFVGGDSGNFKTVGERWCRTLVNVGGLKPHDRVLEVGCGVGRMAIPLTRHLAPPGSYDGFEIVREGVEWCQRKITRRFPHFRFLHADIYNQHYNPGGRLAASEYEFPYPADSFDFVFLTSVFTHMLPADVEHYLGEVGRVLRPGGRCLITYFILNEESLRLMEEGRAGPDRNFRHELGRCRVVNEDAPEAAVAYAESEVRRMYEEAGLSIVEPVLYGGWSGRPGGISAQDIVIARKP